MQFNSQYIQYEDIKTISYYTRDPWSVIKAADLIKQLEEEGFMLDGISELEFQGIVQFTYRRLH